MAIRQYIGARYTIKVYENSLDPSSAEWEANVTYEPITLVTYNNSSYLSKKDVPANIGNPAANPQYWVVTGNFNGQIAVLDAKISNLNGSCYVMHPTGDTTDRSSELIDALNDYSMILFTVGDYYFNSTVSIPSGTKIIGCGLNTVLKFASGATGYMFDVDDDVIIDSIKFDGGLTSTPTTYANRGAIKYTNHSKTLKMINCEIYGFGGYGIYVADVGYGHLASISAVNCYFRYNYAGVYFDVHGEYALLTNDSFIDNYYGVYCLGGNEQFDNCGFNRNTYGAYFDGTNSSNNGHSVVSNCSFNHNTDTGLYIYKITNGLIVSNCVLAGNTTNDLKCDNSYYSQISIDNCEFIPGKITVVNNSVIYFSDCSIVDHASAALVAVDSTSVLFPSNNSGTGNSGNRTALEQRTVSSTYETNSCVTQANYNSNFSIADGLLIARVNFNVTTSTGSQNVKIATLNMPANSEVIYDNWEQITLSNGAQYLLGILHNGDIQIRELQSGTGSFRGTVLVKIRI